jgi:ApbE superfamily uncharacterized protein (UPF0280 family)
MREPPIIRVLPDGRRLHLHDGPIDLIVGADSAPQAIDRAYRAAAACFIEILDELCAELPLLRAQVTPASASPQGIIAQRMFAAVAPYAQRCFITPMAAVAGAVAETVLAAMTQAAQLDRAHVNNGGDIAIHLSQGLSYTVGMVERPENPSLLGSVTISGDSSVRGIATSGWRGRSFSLGIADAVTVLAAVAAQADAAATIIANAVDLHGHPAIRRVPAREIAPDSDLGALPVTRDVGPLLAHEIAEALERGSRSAEDLRSQGLIHGAALCLQGRVRLIRGQCSESSFPNNVLGTGGRSFSSDIRAWQSTGLQPLRETLLSEGVQPCLKSAFASASSSSKKFSMRAARSPRSRFDAPRLSP